MIRFFIRLVIATGWAVWLLGPVTIGLVLAGHSIQALLNDSSDSVAQSNQALLLTVQTSATAALGALLFSLPAFLLLCSSTYRIRAVLTAFCLVPLFCLPSVYAYGWLLLSTSQVTWISQLMHLLGSQSDDFAWLHTGIVHALWLWPIAALSLTFYYRRSISPWVEAARTEANRRQILRQIVWPMIRMPLAAALGVVLLISALDATVPPLTGAGSVWSVWYKAQAAASIGQASTIGNLVITAWPMLLLGLSVLCLIFFTSQRHHDNPTMTLSARPLHLQSFYLRWTFFGIVLLLIFSPLLVFLCELPNDLTNVQAWRNLWQVLWRTGPASLLTAIGAALAGATLFILMLNSSTHRKFRYRGLPLIIVMILAAALPPDLIGLGAIQFFLHMLPLSWADIIYDQTPLVWILALLCRFGLIAVILAWVQQRNTNRNLDDAAALDGADRISTLVYIRLPQSWHALLIGSVALAALSLSEISVSIMVQPVRWIGGSLAVWADNEMHYGRNTTTILLGISMMLAALLAVLAIGGLLNRRQAKES